MEDTLINFETAKLAKEKGFDIPQNKMFSIIIDRSIFNKTDNPEVIKFHNGDKHQCSNIPHDWNNTQSQTPTKYYSAPTQSLLQKWLREVHNIHITVTSISQESWQYHIQKPKDKLGDNYNEDYENYEEALEEALQGSLKLI